MVGCFHFCHFAYHPVRNLRGMVDGPPQKTPAPVQRGVGNPPSPWKGWDMVGQGGRGGGLASTPDFVAGEKREGRGEMAATPPPQEQDAIE